MSKITVMCVDDSALMRQLMTEIINSHPDMEMVATAPDPLVARDLIKQFNPQVLTLDVEMPRMDGITFLSKLMEHFPLPVIVVSSLTAKGTRVAVEALEAGAVDVLCKPGSAYSVEHLGADLIKKVKLAAATHVSSRSPLKRTAVQKSAAPTSSLTTTEKIIALGASTGGVQALTTVLTAFPADAPGTVIVQHMPEKFTRSFAERLDSMCQVRVKEAQDGDGVFVGQVLIAPGGHHFMETPAGDYLIAYALPDVR